MAPSRPRHSDVLRDKVTPYVAHRLNVESDASEHGYTAELARKIKFSSQHISTIKSGQKAVGLDFAHAIAAFWGLSYEQLVEEAKAWRSASAQGTKSLVHARTRAIDRLRGVVDERAIAWAETITPRTDIDADEMWWLETIMRKSSELRNVDTIPPVATREPRKGSRAQDLPILDEESPESSRRETTDDFGFREVIEKIDATVPVLTPQRSVRKKSDR
jgi:plasmid maintenance system antidote protein VapI